MTGARSLVAATVRRLAPSPRLRAFIVTAAGVALLAYGAGLIYGPALYLVVGAVAAVYGLFAIEIDRTPRP